MNIKEAKNIISNQTISFDESFTLAKFCGQLLPKDEHAGRELLIRVLDSWEKVSPETYCMWQDVIDIYGLYPYIDFKKITGSTRLRTAFHFSKYLPGITLHEEQTNISLLLDSGASVILSAPTSFGKSLLIEEIVARRKFRNIVIIQPTLALLDETRKRVLQYKDYKILLTTSQQPSTNRSNIFLFTAERVVEYPYFINVDFFILDEFYKLSLDRKDDRAEVLNHALYKLLKFTKRFYLLGPCVRSIPQLFESTYGAIFKHTNFSTIAINEFTFSESEPTDEQKKEILLKLMKKVEGPTLIYCSSPQKTSQLTQYLLRSLDKKFLSSLCTNNNNNVTEWVGEYIHSNWLLIEALKHSFAFHHGALPRHLGSSIIDAFNNGDIRFMLCTSTIIEGVNTTAKNVILYDKKKGTRFIDYFDYKNIAGRSGRMYKHYIGNVYNISKSPEQCGLDVDIPILTKSEATPEILIQIDKSELTENEKSKIIDFLGYPNDLQQLIKSNSGFSIQGQHSIIYELQSKASIYYEQMNWKSYPNYDQLSTVLGLAWKYLLKKGESKGHISSSKQLTTLTLKYMKFSSVSALIKDQISSDYWIKKLPDESERVNELTFRMLNFYRHWIDYKLPKWLSVMHYLQAYAFSSINLSPGNYLFYSATIENENLSSNVASLLEYGIPFSALKKLSKIFSPEDSIESIAQKLRGTDLDSSSLLAYEILKINNFLKTY